MRGDLAIDCRKMLQRLLSFHQSHRPANVDRLAHACVDLVQLDDRMFAGRPIAEPAINRTFGRPERGQRLAVLVKFGQMLRHERTQHALATMRRQHRDDAGGGDRQHIARNRNPRGEPRKWRRFAPHRRPLASDRSQTRFGTVRRRRASGQTRRRRRPLARMLRLRRPKWAGSAHSWHTSSARVGFGHRRVYGCVQTFSAERVRKWQATRNAGRTRPTGFRFASASGDFLSLPDRHACRYTPETFRALIEFGIQRRPDNGRNRSGERRKLRMNAASATWSRK